MIGASPGKIGTAAAQQHLKNILNYCDAVLMNQPEAYVQFPKGLVTADAAVTDETTAGFLRTYMGRFGTFVAAGADRADSARDGGAFPPREEPPTSRRMNAQDFG